MVNEIHIILKSQKSDIDFWDFSALEPRGSIILARMKLLLQEPMGEEFVIDAVDA